MLPFLLSQVQLLDFVPTACLFDLVTLHAFPKTHLCKQINIYNEQTLVMLREEQQFIQDEKEERQSKAYLPEKMFSNISQQLYVHHIIQIHHAESRC